MSGRATTLLIDRLRALAARKGHFCYDVIGDSHVYDGIVAPYRVEVDDVELHELQPVLEHALQHDGMVTGRKDPATGKVRWSSGRHFTDIGNALRFARDQRQTAVFNWNRGTEVPVVPVAVPTASHEALEPLN